MEFINHQIVDASWQRAIGVELVTPKLTPTHPIRFLPNGIAVGVHLEERSHDLLGIDHHRAAFGAVQILTGTVPGRWWRILVPRVGIGWVLAAAADLAAGINIAAIGNRTIFPGDAEHVGGMVEAGEAGQRRRIGHRGRPDAVLDSMHRNGRRDALSAVRDITPDRFAAHHFDALGVRCPDRKADCRFGLTGDEQLVRAQPAAVGQVIALGLIGGAQRENAVALGDGGIANFGRDAPRIGSLRGIDIHAPAEGLTDLAVVEIDRGPKGGAAVLGGERFHRHGGPLLGPQTHGVPVARQAGADRKGLPQPCQILEPYWNQCHGECSV